MVCSIKFGDIGAFFLYFIVYLLLNSYKINYITPKFRRFFEWNFQGQSLLSPKFIYYRRVLNFFKL